MEDPAPASRFDRFPDLPAEIRILIWREARQPRVIEIVPGIVRTKYGALLSEDDRAEVELPKMTIAPTVRPLAVLQANRESRDETLPGYCLVRFPSYGPDFMVSTPWFRFNPEVDTLRLVTWCLCHEGRPHAPGYWVSQPPPPSCPSVDGLLRALNVGNYGQFRLVNSALPRQDESPETVVPSSQSLPHSVQWRSWAEDLVHLAFDASLLLKLANFNDPKSLWALYNARMTCDEIAMMLEKSQSMRTCTITMASAPLSHAAPRFPLAGDMEVTQSYNVRAVRIARKPHSTRGEPKLRQDGAVMVYHDHRQPAAGCHEMAIFELLDDSQKEQFTRPVGGATALARRMSWLIRTAPGPRCWLRILEPVNPNTAFRESFTGDMKMLLTEWLLLEAHTTKRRLSAVCHGICMPDYGF